MDDFFVFILSIAINILFLFVAFYLGVLMNAWFVANSEVRNSHHLLNNHSEKVDRLNKIEKIQAFTFGVLIGIFLLCLFILLLVLFKNLVV
jgi:hypothetical protein